MSYDTSLLRLQEIVTRLESNEAIGLDDYKALAQEAQQLLTFCRQQLTSIEEQMKNIAI